MRYCISSENEGEFPNLFMSIRTHNPKSINQCFQSKLLRPLIQKAQEIRTVEKFLNQILPSEIVPHCRIINLSQETLILQLEKATWATRIYYLIPNLLERFSQQKFNRIRKIRCRVRPNLYI
ncbi:DUF721 domain-containing protein [Coxiella endosymbiont of Amblyomma sculptum]|uniref:DciA family protein n=1 Tax=Coxiella endosymbiont of Amblyomma sculptum TaxID=2487929 RepID=UPI00132F1406|nr:DUF721 domain-containing protein [Coxiella endosymbiont of Amblyomma sculptum]